MVNHVRVIVVLNAVQGILELIMGGFVTAMSVMFFAMKDKIIEEEDLYVNYIEYFLDLLEGNYRKLSSIGVERSDISIFYFAQMKLK